MSKILVVSDNVKYAYTLTAEFVNITNQQIMMFVGYIAMLGIISSDKVSEVLL